MFQETRQKDIQLAKPIPAVDQEMDRLYTQGQEVEHSTLIHLEINRIRIRQGVMMDIGVKKKLVWFFSLMIDFVCVFNFMLKFVRNNVF